MACLPDEVWIEALQLGVRARILDHRDLCSLSIVSRRLNRLSSLSFLWKPLFEREFSQGESSTNITAPSDLSVTLKQWDYKSQYKLRWGKVKAAKALAHKRRVLRIQSDVAVLEKECKDLEREMQAEKIKLSNILTELQTLEQARRSSVALKLWQPEIVRLVQEQVVRQQPIDPQFRHYSLEMEAKVCREEIKKCRRRIVGD
ncbi:hypothetical protein KP509_27G060900 [Ceratopteris richardii]|uniref:F-box domain-containing protein n=1 Tax=Ceratopteris richardii TaxID=49495 RepID=A0A8T2RIA8_CERRI|nr:hypothetical protein KP509_27G060900 [Ceratopteris richardii]